MIQGLHLDGKKDASLITWTIKRFQPPPRVHRVINDGNYSAIPCVRIGEHVRIGELIAKPSDPSAVAIHASISGEIYAIGGFAHPLLGEAETIEIRSDGRGEAIPEIGKARSNLKDFAAEEIMNILRDSGVVSLDERMKPLHEIIAQAQNNEVKTLVLNGCESEPYLTCEYSLVMTHALEILKGAEVIRNLIGAERVIVAFEDHKLEAAELLRSKIYFLKWENYEVKILPALYPQDTEIPLARKIFGIDAADLDSAFDHQFTAINMATAFAVYEAVMIQKPFFERVVTVGGECVVEPKNIWAPLGITFHDAIKACRGLMREPRKVIMNGPMKGIALPHAEVPVIAGTRAILALPKEVATAHAGSACVRCKRCVDVCPVEISPMTITLAAEQNLPEVIHFSGVHFCIECGNCSYICPSKRPMVDLIRFAKAKVAKKKDFEALKTKLEERQVDFSEALGEETVRRKLERNLIKQ